MRFVIPMIAIGFAISGCVRPPEDIAIVDTESIFKNYKKSKSAYEALEKERLSLEIKGQEMLDEINKLVKESELLSEETRREREKRIREKSAALEAFHRDAGRGLAERTNEEYKKLMEDVRAAAAAVGQRRGIKIFLDASTAVYSAKGMDVTGEIIEELNRRLDAKKSGASAGADLKPSPARPGDSM